MDRLKVPPIIPEPTFQAVQAKRAGRVQRLLATAQERLRPTQADVPARLQELRAALERNRLGSTRLYAAVEQGLLPMDGTLTARALDLTHQRQALLAQIASLERDRSFASSELSPKRVDTFCRTMRARLLDDTTEVAKRSLRLLVDEIRVAGKTAILRGSYAALAHATRTDRHAGATLSVGYD